MLKLEELSTSVSDVLRESLDDQILDSVGDQTQTDMRARSCTAPQRTRLPRGVKGERKKETKIESPRSAAEHFRTGASEDLHFCLGRNEEMDM